MPRFRSDEPSTEAWYEDWFGREEYKLVYRRRDEKEAEECIDLIERAVSPAPDARVLDVGCGRGRHARILARRGYRVTGTDLSERSLREARKRAQEDGLSIDYLRKDMRETVCEDCFDGAVNLFTAFGYFQKEADHVQTLRAITAALRPGGWFVQDFLNADYVRETLVPRDSRTANGTTIEQERWIEDGRINKRIQIERKGRTKIFRESVRLFTLEDFRTLYRRVGLALEATYGDYDGRPFAPTSPRLIMVSRNDR